MLPPSAPSIRRTQTLHQPSSMVLPSFRRQLCRRDASFFKFHPLGHLCSNRYARRGPATSFRPITQERGLSPQLQPLSRPLSRPQLQHHIAGIGEPQINLPLESDCEMMRCEPWPACLINLSRPLSTSLAVVVVQRTRIFGHGNIASSLIVQAPGTSLSSRRGFKSHCPGPSGNSLYGQHLGQSPVTCASRVEATRRHLHCAEVVERCAFVNSSTTCRA